MKSRTWLIAAAMALAFAPLAHAQYTNYQGPVVNASGQTVQGPVPVSAATPLPVTVANQTGTSASQVQGSSASGATDDGSNPVKDGGVYLTTPPTYTNGQRGTMQLGSRGALNIQIEDGNGSATAVTVTGGVGDASSNSQNGMYVYSRPALYNGSLWDREFTCTSSATVSVTAGNTTQIVGLSGSTVIRVCSIAISMSAAGSAGVYTGTGTNCATGSTALIQDMTLATGTPLQLSAGNGSLVRSSAGGEICFKAVTGNVTGVVTYAQF